MLDVDTEKRLQKLESDIRGFRAGSDSLQRMLEEKFDSMEQLIASKSDTIAPSTFALILLAASNMLIALIVLVFLLDYYFFA